MVILGLGSNQGDRLAHLRKAFALIKKIPELFIEQVSPIYLSDALLPDNAPLEWNTPYLNLALRCETKLNPYELLRQIKNIENVIGRKPEKRWSPRIIDIDILAWDDFIQYDALLHIPHENLHERPFALWPLADVAPFWIYPLPNISQGKTAAEMSEQWGSRFSGDAPFHTRQILHRIDTPALVGIVNVTPDSFSDGGKFHLHSTAIHHIHHLVESGAEIIDLGAEATGPHAKKINAEEEWHRLEPVLKHVIAELPNMLLQPKISIDTRNAATAKKALALGVNWINDVSGLDDALMRDVIKECQCDVIVMHHLDIPENRHHTLPRNENSVLSVLHWAEKHLSDLEKQGISKEKIIFDVGIGYGKTAEQSLALLKNISAFKKLGTRLLVGHSRKSFLKLLTDKDPIDRDVETTGLSLFLGNEEVDYLRLHNVEANARAFRVMRTLK